MLLPDVLEGSAQVTGATLKAPAAFGRSLQSQYQGQRRRWRGKWQFYPIQIREFAGREFAFKEDWLYIMLSFLPIREAPRTANTRLKTTLQSSETAQSNRGVPATPQICRPNVTCPGVASNSEGFLFCAAASTFHCWMSQKLHQAAIST